MSLASLEQALPEGDRLLLDSSTLLSHFDGSEAATPLADHIVHRLVVSGRNLATVSVVSVVEVLIRPLRIGAAGGHEHVLDVLSNFPNLRTVPVDLFIAQEAANVRALFNLAVPDALIVGTGLVHQVGHLVTNDRNWRAKLAPLSHRIGVCYLGDHLPA
jgi:predicted nucleic acid-binding protein